MSATPRHDVPPYPPAWHRALADAVRKLAQALDAHGTFRQTPSPAPPDDMPPAEATPSESARQEALLWIVSLVLDWRCRTWSAQPGAPPGADEAATAASITLTDLLARIDAASAAAPPIRAAVAGVRQLLAATDIAQVWPPDSRAGCASTALTYLVERLWAATDRPLRRQRGGYFTPPGLVAFTVRAVDHLLRTELGVADGLATDEDVLRVIDPACGSGAFLLGVCDYLRRLPTLSAEDCWQRFARDVLPARLVGIDVLPACCGAAEMLLQLRLGVPWRAHCGNILEEVALAQRLCGDRLPVIIGNPPYANFGRRNRGPWIRQQLAAYKSGLAERKHNLDDDFVKFLRWGQYWIDRTGTGILAMVTSHTYLAGLTHRVMRASLAASFDHLYLLDLHGNQKKREHTPAGTRDENVFDIQTGVAIGLLVKCRARTTRRQATVRHAELWGSRHEKLAALSGADLTSIPWEPVPLRAPYFFFVPRPSADEAIYRQWPRLDEIFEQYVSGVQSKCDALFVGFSRHELEARMCRVLDGSAGEARGAELPAWLRPRLAGVTFDRGKLRPYMVAPWDVRWIYYDPALLGRARYSVMRHLDGRTLALIFMRQACGPEPYDQVLATRVLVSDRVFYSAHGAPFLAPLYTGEGEQQRTNLRADFLGDLAQRLGLRWNDAPDDAYHDTSFSSQDVFHWLYAVLYSPRYRRQFDSLLRLEFPRVPSPRDAATFRALARLGQLLVQSHCDVVGAQENDSSADNAWSPDVNMLAGTTGRSARSGRAGDDAEQTWRRRVENAVWEFRIGGYRVLPRWFRQRRQRPLTELDHGHILRMAAAIRQTLQCSESIDRLGW
ncbi:MAG: hypothetical protein MUF48_21695 [Pirellulaceae bacterium]|jgi:hypothetical protein|nr:hypothetical protein [Pirellulaceae bacterium]